MSEKPFFISSHEVPPSDFSPQVEVAACYLVCQRHILFLKRHPDKPQGNTWGVPAGKMEVGETAEETVIRETLEEVAIQLDPVKLKNLGKRYIKYSHVDFIYHIFFQKFEEFPKVVIGLQEHVDFKWCTLEEALNLPLIGGGAQTLLCFHQLTKKGMLDE